MYLAAWLIGAAARWSATDAITMKTNMALSLLIAGVALPLVEPRRTTATRRVVGTLLATLVLMVGSLTLMEHVFDADFGIDQLLATEPPGAVATARPNRVGPPGSVSLMLLGLGLLTLAVRRRFACYFALATMVVVLVPAVGFLSGVVQFYGEAVSGIAWLTVIALLLLSFGLHFAEGPEGALGLIWQHDAGGRLLRRALPAAILVPLALQALQRLGAHHGLHGHDIGVGILLIGIILVMSALLWRSARNLSAEEAHGREAEAEAHWRADLLDLVHDAVLVWSPAGGIQSWNQGAQELYGYTSAEAVGRSPHGLLRTQGPPQFAAIAEEVRSSGRWEGELRHQTKDGREVVVSSKFRLVRGIDGSERVLEVNRDITNRVHAEEALRESEGRYRLLFQNMLEGFAYCRMVFDERGRPDDFVYLGVNDAFGRLTGLHQVVGKKVTEVIPGIREAHPELLETYGRVARTGKPERFEIDFQPLGLWLSVSVYGPRPDHFVAVFDDITSRKRVEQDLRNANRAKDEFLGLLSHELRNPLAPIRNSLYILERAEPTGQQARRAKEVIGRQVGHLAHLVDDLLEVTRITRGKVQLRRAGLDLGELARRTGEDQRDLLKKRGLDFAVHTPDRPVWVDGDETRLAQIIGNLLHNAAKFTPTGGKVTLSVIAAEGAVELHVLDTGTGIAPALIGHVFEPFVQAEQTLARTEGGLGLGLALVKGLVELHGGSVEARSGGEGRGAEFVVHLPIGTAPEVERADGSGVGGPHRVLRVLVVEDNPDAADSLAELVRMYGHEVEVAYDGSSAITKATTTVPDLVLCDIGLPGMNGYDVARALRSNPDFRTTRLVAVTGYAQPEDVQRATEAGFIGHIAKPPDPSALETYLGVDRVP